MSNLPKSKLGTDRHCDDRSDVRELREKELETVSGGLNFTKIEYKYRPQ